MHNAPNLKPKTCNLKPGTGFAMIEVIVGMGIAAMLLAGFATFIAESAKIARTNASSLKATLYLREAIEVAKDLEQSNWSGVTGLANPACLKPLLCHQQISASVWTLVAGSEVVDGTYTRSVTIEPVWRDTCTPPNTIVSATTAGAVICPTPINPDTHKITAAIAWNSGASVRSMTLETYVYNMP